MARSTSSFIERSRWLLALLGFVSLAACVAPETATQRKDRAARLAEDLRSLGPDVSSAEATALATAAVERAHELNRQWKPARNPWINNFFVNIGLRDRGLCHQWRESLFPTLHQLHPGTLDLHLAAARRATLREHNGIVVTAHDAPFDDGIILDAWRAGGILKWSCIPTDHYPWKPLPRELTPLELQPLLFPAPGN